MNLKKILENIIEEEKTDNIDIITTLVWQHQGATQDMELAEFISGILDKRFTNQIQINKTYLKIKHGRRNKKNISTGINGFKE